MKIRRFCVIALSMVLCALPSAFAASSSKVSYVGSEILFSKGDNGFDTYRIPSLVQARDGSIVAFAEARKNSSDDTGDIDIVCRRSTDGGETWGEIVTVWDAGENVCGNPTPVLDRRTGRLLLLATWNNVRDNEAAIHARTSIDTRRVYVLHSDDNGQTWSEPREITSSVKLDEWTWYATGPCHAIQLQKGKNKGRIVVPCNHGVFGQGTVSHVIYSDDGGETWSIGGSAGTGNESTIAELQNGRLMLNMRSVGEPDEFRRIVAISRDGGETFGKPYHDDALIEPVCNASLVNYTPKGKLTGTLLFSNPDSRTARERLTVKRSDDSGKTWRTAYKIDTAPAAYSDIIVLNGGDVAVLFETGEKTPYEEIDFTLIPASYFPAPEPETPAGY